MNSTECPSWEGVDCKAPLPPSHERSSHWYKARISVDTDPQGEKRILKAYPSPGFLVRYYFLALANREYAMLKRVEELPFTPADVDRNHHCANQISYQYIDGRSIKVVSKSETIPNDFFPKLYSAVLKLHQQGTAHLDLGNSGNILVTRAGNPVIIDFGSAFSLERLPAFLQRWMRKKDLLGMLKLWQRFDRETMPAFLLEYYQRHYRKNIYTPTRFYKAIKKHLTKARVRRAESNPDDASIIRVVGLVVGLMILISLW